jgi:hypothetical protein
MADPAIKDDAGFITGRPIAIECDNFIFGGT